MKKNATFASLLVICAGCYVAPIVKPITFNEKEETTYPLPKEIKTSITHSKTVHRNDFFRFEISDNGATSIHVEKDLKPDIRHWAAFWSTLYKRDVSTKLQKGETLSQADLQILVYAFDAQLMALQTFSASAYCGLIGTNLTYYTPTVELPKDVKKEKQNHTPFVQDCHQIAREMVDNFELNGNPLHKEMMKWVADYSIVETRLHDAMFRGIASGEGRQISDADWRGRYAPDALIDEEKRGLNATLACEYIGDLTVENHKESYRVNDVDKDLAGDRWCALSRNLKFYEKDLELIYNDMARSIEKTHNPDTKNKISELRFLMDQKMCRTIRHYRHVFYDFPFCFACCNAYAMASAAKGKNLFHDDNEELMIVEGCNFVRATAGQAMIKFLSSPYSASLYTEFIEFLKAELVCSWYDGYETLKTKSRLFDNTGSLDFSNTARDPFAAHNLDEKK